MTPLMRSAIRDLDSSLAIKSVRTMDEVVRGTLGLPRLTSFVVGAFALIALGLMAAGVYGLMAFTTAQRLPEFSVRMALGADPGQVLRMIVRQGFTTTAIGIAGRSRSHSRSRSDHGLAVLRSSADRPADLDWCDRDSDHRSSGGLLVAGAARLARRPEHGPSTVAPPSHTVPLPVNVLCCLPFASLPCGRLTLTGSEPPWKSFATIFERRFSGCAAHRASPRRPSSRLRSEWARRRQSSRSCAACCCDRCRTRIRIGSSALWEEHPGGSAAAGNRWLSRSTYAGWRDRTRTLDALGGYSLSDYQLASGSEGFKAFGARVSPAVLDTLGVAPALGRFLTDQDDREGAAPVVILE